MGEKLRSTLVFLLPVTVGLLAMGIYVRGIDYLWVDDSYIFLRYVKHLSNGEGLVFNLDEPSFGMTSILWTLVLAAVHFFTKGDLVGIARGLSMILFACGGGLLALVIRRSTRKAWSAAWIASLCVAYPTAAKMGGSGMEMGLHFFLFCLLLTLIQSPRLSSLWLGGLAGMLFLTRPDEIVLVPILLLALLWHEMNDQQEIMAYLVRFGSFALAYLIAVLPWIGYMSLHIGALVLPTGKGRLILWMPVLYGMTYPDYLSLNLLGRVQIALRSLTYFVDLRRMILLFSLTAIPIWLGQSMGKAIRRTAMVGGLYAVSVPLLFAVSYPILDFRYLVNMLAIGFFCLAILVDRGVSWLGSVLSGRVNRSWMLYGLTLITIAAYAGLHIVTYERFKVGLPQQSIRIETGQWLAQNTPDDATIAMEPIGAIGFYANRYVFDMGGLISAEAQRLMPRGCTQRDEMSMYLRTMQPDFLVDCSGLCPAQPVLETYNYHFELVAHFGPEEPSERVVGCSIYRLGW